MAMPRPAALLLLGALLGGCLDSGAPGPQALPDTSADLTHPLERMPGPRAAVASVRMHEEVDGAAADLPFAEGDQPWAPRDVDLTYHGIQEVHDEFARPVHAYVLRFPHMVFVADTIEAGPAGLAVEGHYEPHDYEFHFAVTDGHLVGVVDATLQMRAWTPPDWRSPLASLAVASMAFKAFEAGDRKPMRIGEFDGHALHYTFVPFEGTAPLPGTCDAWELDSFWDPPRPEGAADEVAALAPEDEARTLVCIEEGHEVPLWAWSGDGQGSYRLLRTGGTLATPAHAGEPLPAVDYAEAPWQEVDGPLGVPGPLMVPPTADGGRWAQEVGERAASLYLSPGYLKYRLSSDLPYVDIAFLDVELGRLLDLPVQPPSPLPLLGDRSSRLSIYVMTDSNTSHTHLITTQEGEPEGPDIHVADPQGSDFPEQFGKPLPASRLPPLVPDGPLEGQLGPLLPEAVDLLVFVFFTFEGSSGPHSFAQWSVLQDCSQTEDGWGAAADGLLGNILAATVLPAGGPDCGEGAARWPLGAPVRPAGPWSGRDEAGLGQLPAAAWAPVPPR